MKYLKTFENSEEIEFGVTPEDIEYLLTDISDNGWIVDVKFMRKLYDFSTGTRKPLLKFALLPYIQISIGKNLPLFQDSLWKINNELSDLKNSEEYKEIIEVVSLRLDDLGYYIHKEYVENKHLNILIYRKTDQNYIK
jgi:hypothetical protein